MLALGLFLKDNGGKQHCLIPFVGGWNIVEKEGEHHKGCTKIEDWGTYVYFVLRFQENSMQNLSAW